MQRARTEDVRYVELAQAVTSPIIMSHRVGDFSPEILTLRRVIARKYAAWGYLIPESLVPPSGIE